MTTKPRRDTALWALTVVLTIQLVAWLIVVVATHQPQPQPSHGDRWAPAGAGLSVTCVDDHQYVRDDASGSIARGADVECDSGG